MLRNADRTYCGVQLLQQTVRQIVRFLKSEPEVSRYRITPCNRVEEAGRPGYGPTPPLWQSAQLTWVRSPKSTGCWKVGAGAALAVPSVSDSRVWHWLQSLPT